MLRSSESFNICMKLLVYTLSFCCLHAISNTLLFALRLEIMNLSDFIKVKRNIYIEATQSDDLKISEKCSKQALE